MSEGLEDLCINKKGIPVFRKEVKRANGERYFVCDYTRFKAENDRIAAEIRNRRLAINGCPYLMDALFYAFDTDSYYLGCSFKKHKVSDIVKDDWEGF